MKVQKNLPEQNRLVVAVIYNDIDSDRCEERLVVCGCLEESRVLVVGQEAEPPVFRFQTGGTTSVKNIISWRYLDDVLPGFVEREQHGGVRCYRKKKKATIEAVRLTFMDWDIVCDFVPKPYFIRGVWVHNKTSKWSDDKLVGYDRIGLLIDSLGQQLLVTEGDYIVKRGPGQFFPCKKKNFEQNYEEI